MLNSTALAAVAIHRHSSCIGIHARALGTKSTFVATNKSFISHAERRPATFATGSHLERHQTRLRFGGRQPLCGIGVTSRIERTSSPAAASARTADSRPEPGRQPEHRPNANRDRAPCWRRSPQPAAPQTGSLTRPAKAERTRALPRQRVALTVGDGHDGVVERRLNVDQTVWHILALALLELLVFAGLPGSAC